MNWIRYCLLRASIRLRPAANRLIRWYLREDERPPFYEVDDTRPDLRRLEEATGVIRAELESVLPWSESVPRYHELDPDQRELSSDTDEGWRVLPLYMQGAPEQPNRSLCPRTVALLEEQPRVMGAFFSILSPRKSIAPHRGPTLANLRYHLPLIVPRDAPPTLRVKDEHHTWKEGRGVLFDDSLPHSVRNESAKPRVVLVVDLWRPLPFALDALNRLIGWCWRMGTDREAWLEGVRHRTLQVASAASSSPRR